MNIRNPLFLSYIFPFLFIFLVAALSLRGQALIQPVQSVGNVEIVAHRAFASVAPENTIPAIEAAIRTGIGWVELDIHVSKDQQLVCVHNQNLKKYTGKDVNVSDLTLAEIQQLDAGDWFSARYNGARIPAFREALLYCKDKVNINVDPKSATPELLVSDIMETQMEDQVIIYGSPQFIKRIKEISKNKIATQIGYNPQTTQLDELDNLVPFSVEVKAEHIAKDLVKELHSRNIVVMAQAMGQNDIPSEWLRCIGFGVDQIITDHPELALATLIHSERTGKIKTKIAAHRGASEFAPENTMIAFSKAIEMGADFIEIDVRQTRDGEHVILHDSKLDRTTNGKGILKDHNFKEIKDLSAGAWFGYPYAEQKIPTLEKVCRLLQKTNQDRAKKISFYVDCKDVDPETLVKMLDQFGHLDKALFYGSPDVLREIISYAPGAKLMPGIGRKEQLIRIHNELQPYAIDAKWSLIDDEFIREADKLNIRVFSDAMSNEETEQYQKAVNSGIYTIQTDRILNVLKAIEQMENPD